MELTEREEGFLKLLMRSPDTGDGWRKVSKLCTPLVHEFSKKELIETQEIDSTLMVRLSQRGSIVCDYI